MRGRLGFLANRPSKTRSDGPYVGFHADSTNRGAVEGKKRQLSLALQYFPLSQVQYRFSEPGRDMNTNFYVLLVSFWRSVDRLI